MRKRAENGPGRIYKDTEPLVVKRENILGGEVSDQEISDLEVSDQDSLQFYETFPPFQALECGPILDLGDSSQDLKKRNKATFVESESDERGNEMSVVVSLKIQGQVIPILLYRVEYWLL